MCQALYWSPGMQHKQDRQVPVCIGNLAQTQGRQVSSSPSQLSLSVLSSPYSPTHHNYPCLVICLPLSPTHLPCHGRQGRGLLVTPKMTQISLSFNSPVPISIWQKEYPRNYCPEVESLPYWLWNIPGRSLKNKHKNKYGNPVYIEFPGASLSLMTVSRIFLSFSPFSSINMRN